MSSDHYHQQPVSQSSSSSSSSSSAQQSVQQSSQHSISVKVMRLGKPSLQLNNDGKFLLKPEVDSCIQESDGIFKESLKIPSSFGNITVGEVLKCCICVTNTDTNDLTNVVIRVEINKYTNNSATQLVYKNVILDTSSQPIATLPFGGKINHIVQHKVIDSGYHHIVCSVRYTRHTSTSYAAAAAAAAGQVGVGASGTVSPTQQMTLTKNYGFNVSQPMSIQTRIHCLYHKEGHKWLVEAQAAAKVPVFLESFSMDPSDACTCKVLSPQSNDSDNTPSDDIPSGLLSTEKSRFPAHLPRFKALEKYFGPDSVIHRVFEVTLRPNYNIPQTLGTINISWNGQLGSTNKMSTPVTLSQEMTNPSKSSSMISLVGIVPETPSVQLYKPFTLKCTFVNMGQKTIKATVAFTEDMTNNTGISLADHIAAGEPIFFEPKKEFSTTFNLVALHPGLQSIGKITLTNLATGKKMVFKDLGSIVVL